MVIRMKKHKILIVHNYYQIPGGEDTVVANEMKLLRDNGHEVVLYTRNNNELNNFNKLRKIFLPFTTVFSIRTFREVKKIIKQQKIDVVHVHNTLNLISPSVYYAAFTCKVTVIQTIHNFRLLCPGGLFYRSGNICDDCVSNGLKSAVTNKCYRGSMVQSFAIAFTLKLHRILGTYTKIDGYICLSNFMKEKMAVLIDQNKVFVKPNFMNRTPKVEEDKTNIDTNIDDYYLYIGRIETNKGIQLLLDAFEKLPNEKLLIIGDGVYKEQMLKTIANKNLSNVSYLGFITGIKKKKLVKNAKAVIVPSQSYESFGMVVIEAYQLLTPVIVSNLGTLPNLIKEGETGMTFKSDSAEDLSETVKKMKFFNKEDFEENIKTLFEKKYSEEVNYNMLIDIYQKCSLNQSKSIN
jgi:glycosyltransferase involved in cell wall biosynthesis